MSNGLTAQEVLIIAEQLERKGQAFFQRAARDATDTETRKLFADLAEMEGQHEQVFAAARDQLPAQTTRNDSEKMLWRFWPGFANAMLEDLDREMEELFDGKAATADILRAAVEFEKATIVLFTGFKPLLPGPAEREQVENILREELGHLLLLSSQLAKALEGHLPGWMATGDSIAAFE